MANGHGGRRQGAGRRLGSKDRATREAKATLSELAREHSDEAIRTLHDVMVKGESESARIAAAGALLDRGYGRPSQAVEHAAGDAALPIILNFRHLVNLPNDEPDDDEEAVGA